MNSMAKFEIGNEVFLGRRSPEAQRPISYSFRRSLDLSRGRPSTLQGERTVDPSDTPGGDESRLSSELTVP